MKFGHDRFHLTDGVSALVALGDGTIVAAGSGSETIVWDVATAEIVARTSECSFSLAFEDARTLWMGMARIHRWRFSEDEPELITTELRHPIAISHTRRFLAAAYDPTEDGDIGLLLLDRPDITRLRGRGARIHTLSFSPDGSHLAIGDANGAWIVRLRDGKRLDVPAPTDGRRGIVAFVPNSETLIVAREVSKEIVFLDRHGTIERVLLAPDWVQAIALTPDGERLVVAYDDGVTVADVKTGQTIAETQQHGDRKHAAFVSSDLVAASTQRTVRFFDAEKKTWDDAAPAHSDRVASLDLSRDGTILVTSGRFDKTVRVWRTADGTLLRTFELAMAIASLSLSPDAVTIVVGTFTGDVVLLDTQTGKQTTAKDAHENFNVGVAYLPDGTIVTAGGGEIVRRNSDTLPLEQSFALFPRGTATDDVRLAASADGRWLLITVEDRMTIYDMGTSLAVFSRDNVRAAALAPESSLVAWADDDSVVVAELPIAREVARWNAKLVSDLAMLGDGRVAVAFFRGNVSIFEIGVRESSIVSQEPPAASVACSGVLLAMGYEDGTAVTAIVPPSTASARERVREEDLAPLRALIRSVGVRTQAVMYRDAPLDSGIDPDECGLYVEREGIGIRIRGTVADGHFVLAAAKATRDEAIAIPQEPEGILAHIKDWFQDDDDRFVLRRGTLVDLPTPEDFDAWLTSCAAHFARL